MGIEKVPNFVPANQPDPIISSKNKKAELKTTLPSPKTDPPKSTPLINQAKPLSTDPENIVKLMEEVLLTIDNNSGKFDKIIQQFEILNAALKRQDFAKVQEISEALTNVRTPFDEVHGLGEFIDYTILPITSALSNDIEKSVPYLKEYNFVMEVLKHLHKTEAITHSVFLFLENRIVRTAAELSLQIKDPTAKSELDKWVTHESKKLKEDMMDHLVHIIPTIISYTNTGTGAVFDLFKNSIFVSKYGQTVLNALNISWNIAFIFTNAWDLVKMKEKVEKHDLAAEEAINMGNKVALDRKLYPIPKRDSIEEKNHERIINSRKAVASIFTQKQLIQKALARSRYTESKYQFGLTLISSLSAITFAVLAISGVVVITGLSSGIGVGLIALGLIGTGVALYIYFSKKPNVYKTAYKNRFKIMLDSLFLSLHKARAAILKLELLTNVLKISQHGNHVTVSQKQIDSMKNNMNKLKEVKKKIEHWENKIAPLQKAINQAKWKDLLNSVYKNDEKWLKISKLIRPDNSRKWLDQLNAIVQDKRDAKELVRLSKVFETKKEFSKSDTIKLYNLLIKYELTTMIPDTKETLWKDIFEEMVDSLFINPNEAIGKETEAFFKYLGIDLDKFKEELKDPSKFAAAKNQIKAMLI